MKRSRGVNLTNLSGGSRRTVRLGSLEGVTYKDTYSQWKVNQVDTSHTGRSVQGSSPLVYLLYDFGGIWPAV